MARLDSEPDPLATELASHAVRRKSIAPDALEHCKFLLASEAVLHRAGPRATTTELAQTAHDVLQALIDSRRDRDEHLMVQALLAAGEFEGRIVDQRKQMLARLGISARRYKENRPRLLEWLTNSLKSELPCPIQPRRTRKMVPAEHAEAVSNLECVVRDTERLRHAIMTAIFMEENNYFLFDGYTKRSTEHRYKSELCERHLLDGYVALVISGEHGFGDHPNARRTMMGKYLPADLLNEVVDHLTKIHDFAALSTADTRVATYALISEPIVDYSEVREQIEFFRFEIERRWVEELSDFEHGTMRWRLRQMVRHCESLARAADDYIPMSIPSDDVRTFFHQIAMEEIATRHRNRRHSDAKLRHHYRTFLTRRPLTSAQVPDYICIHSDYR